MRRLIALIIVACPSIVLAQSQRFEIIPTLGFRQGGAIQLEERAFYHEDFSLDIASSNALGLRLEIPVNQRFAIELMAERQSSEIKDDQGIFGWKPGGFYTEFDTDIVDAVVTYYHVGLVWDIGQAPFRGFLVGSVGAAEIDLPQLPLPKDTVLSASVGGGVQLDISEHFGLLLELRLFYSDTDDSQSATQDFTHIDCGATCSFTWRYESGMTQTELTFGLVFKL